MALQNIRFTGVELGVMKAVILSLEAATNAAERRTLLSKLTSFTSSMISFRRPTTGKRPGITLRQIQKIYFLDSQDTLYTFFYEEKNHAVQPISPQTGQSSL